MRKNLLLRLINFWPPFLGAGIRVKNLAPDFSSVEVEMKMRWWNRNYVNTHFGGSLYAMTDPFYMLLLLESLGRDYIVWDKAANIRFKRPGTGRMRARFVVTPERIAEIRREADSGYKAEPMFLVEVINDQNEVVAEVEKLLYVRRKDRAPKP